MLSIITCPKAFQGKDAINQENAIKSWMIAAPGADISLVGNDPGVAEFARAHKLRHIEGVGHTPLGTPLVNSVFALGEHAAQHDLILYINTDIILPPSFGGVVARCLDSIPDGKPFLVYGGRWNTEIGGPIDFSDPSWYQKLYADTQTRGWLDDRIAMDYFIFPKGIDWQFPPFALGRFSWDSWLPWRVHELGGWLIDASHAISIIHPRHNYFHFTEKTFRPFTPEEKMNWQLLGFGHRYTLGDATHVMNAQGIPEAKPGKLGRRHFGERLKETKIWGSYLMRGAWYPYSYPLYWIWSRTKRIATRIRSREE
jgi:hypothetical protein